MIPSGDPAARIDSIYGYGAAGRDLRLVVMGNPFVMPQADFDRLAEAALQGPLVRVPPTRPTLAPGPSARANYALVLAFRPASPLTGQDLCGGQMDGRVPVSAAPAPGPAEIEMVAAFCLSGRAVTAAFARTEADGPGDPRFGAMMHAAMLVLFRPDSKELGGGHRSGGATLF